MCSQQPNADLIFSCFRHILSIAKEKKACQILFIALHSCEKGTLYLSVLYPFFFSFEFLHDNMYFYVVNTFLYIKFHAPGFIVAE